MPVDVSIYNQGANALSPVDIATKYATMQSAINQNKLFPGQKQLQTQAVQQGQQAMESNRVGIDSAKMDFMNKQYQALHGELASLSAKPGVTAQDVATVGQRLVNSKIISPEMLSGALKTLPADPAKIPEYLDQIVVTTLSAQEKANMAFGSPSLVNTGQGLKPISTSATKGVRDLPGSTIRVMPSESEMNQPEIIGRDSRGRPIQGTKRQFLQNATGVDPITQQPINPGVNDQVASLDPSIPQQGGPSQDMGRVPGGGIVTALAPGEGETMQQSASAWQKARQYVAGDEGTPNGSAQRLLSLNKALDGLKNAPETGPGSETLQQMRSFILTIAPSVGPLVGVDPEEVASYDEANKYLTAYASQAAGATGSDQRLASALSGNASTKISNLAAQDVVKANIALERTKMAQVALFQQMGGNPEEFADWAAQVNQRIDPRAFAVDLIDGDKRKKMISGMSPADKKKFLESVRLGVSAGVVDPAVVGGISGK